MAQAQLTMGGSADAQTPSIGIRILGLIVGVLFIVFSFPIGLEKLGSAVGWSWVTGIGVAAQGVLGNLFGATSSAKFTSFHNLWSYLLISLLIYLGALVVLSLRHQRADLVGSGFLSLLTGVAILNLLSWVIYLFILLLIGIGHVLGWIFQFLWFIIKWVFQFLWFIGEAIIKFYLFLFGSFWWIPLMILAAVFIFLMVKYWEDFGSTVAMIFGLLLLYSGIGALLYGLYRLFLFLWPYLAPIFRFIFAVLFFLFGVLLVAYVVYGLGALVSDAFRSAWHSGNGRRGVIIASLALGATTAVILMETNLYHLASFPYYPLQFAGFVAANLHEISPIFDVVMALLVIGVSILGVARNLGRLQREPELPEFQFAMVMLSLGLLVAIGLAAVASRFQSS